jgi:hypothetical protein
LPPLFVYGTLIDPATRAAVFGAPQRSGSGRVARLVGYRRVYARGRRYPVLVRNRTAVTEGLLIARVNGRAWGRLFAYEGTEYRIARLRVRTDGRHPVLARVFLPRALGDTSRDWFPR